MEQELQFLLYDLSDESTKVQVVVQDETVWMTPKAMGVLFGDEPGHWILRNQRKTHERWDANEKLLDEMVELLKDALMFEGRTKGRERILELELSNEQVARRIVAIYQQVLGKE